MKNDAMKSYFTLSMAVVSAMLVSSCTSNEPASQPKAMPKPTPTPAPTVQQQPTPVAQPTQTQPVVTAPAKVNYPSFDAWKQDFVQRAVAQGYPVQDVQRLVANAQFLSQIVSSDRNQSEFTKMPWSYVDSSVSSNQVALGKRHFSQNYQLLNQIEQQYGVPASIVTAIWGIESSYGQGTGNADIPSALATLAYEGRRREWAEKELLAMLHLLNRGDLVWHHLKGSWAGGMGHTQFIPTTWQNFGVDGNADGRRNPWAMADALSSTAHYLAKSGWVRGLSPFYEVNLPQNFDYRLTGTKKTLQQWQSLGVQFTTSAPAELTAEAQLWLPAGYQGPALLLTRNFEVIKVYNNSSNYALGVSSLAKAVVGLPTIQKAWPRHEQGLSKAQATLLQQRLTQAGFDTKGTDGVIGTNTRLAFQRWQAQNGHLPDGFISLNSARSLLY